MEIVAHYHTIVAPAINLNNSALFYFIAIYLNIN